jgi:hypothetical protein
VISSVVVDTSASHAIIRASLARMVKIASINANASTEANVRISMAFVVVYLDGLESFARKRVPRTLGVLIANINVNVPTMRNAESRMAFVCAIQVNFHNKLILEWNF